MSGTFAKSVFDVAAEVEAAETNIKHAILAAAQAGDCARIRDIVQRWLSTPPTEVLRAAGEPAHAEEEA